MDYFGARYYWAAGGRWWSVDLLAQRYPSLSPYAFVANNPLHFVDLNGKEFLPKGLKNLLKNPRVKALASFGASKLAEYASKKMEPGKARGMVNLVASGLAFYSGYQSLQVAVAAYAVAFTTAETGVGVVVGVAIGSGFVVLTIYDATLATEYLKKAIQDFQYNESQEQSDEDSDEVEEGETQQQKQDEADDHENENSEDEKKDEELSR